MDEKERKALMESLESLPEDLVGRLFQLAKDTESPEEFSKMLSVGDCPVCGSNKTTDYENSLIGDSTLGICLECSKMWCLECGAVFEEGQKECEQCFDWTWTRTLER